MALDVNRWRLPGHCRSRWRRESIMTMYGTCLLFWIVSVFECGRFGYWLLVERSALFLPSIPPCMESLSCQVLFKHPKIWWSSFYSVKSSCYNIFTTAFFARCYVLGARDLAGNLGTTTHERRHVGPKDGGASRLPTWPMTLATRYTHASVPVPRTLLPN